MRQSCRGGTSCRDGRPLAGCGPVKVPPDIHSPCPQQGHVCGGVQRAHRPGCGGGAGCTWQPGGCWPAFQLPANTKSAMSRKHQPGGAMPDALLWPSNKCAAHCRLGPRQCLLLTSRLPKAVLAPARWQTCMAPPLSTAAGAGGCTQRQYVHTLRQVLQRSAPDSAAPLLQRSPGPAACLPAAQPLGIGAPRLRFPTSAPLP